MIRGKTPSPLKAPSIIEPKSDSVGRWRFDEKFMQGFIQSRLQSSLQSLLHTCHVNGDYSRGAGGFWVENGQIQYPVSEVTIAGNLADMFMQIVGCGNDVDTRSNVQTGSILIEQMRVGGN